MTSAVSVSRGITIQKSVWRDCPAYANSTWGMQRFSHLMLFYSNQLQMRPERLPTTRKEWQSTCIKISEKNKKLLMRLTLILKKRILTKTLTNKERKIKTKKSKIIFSLRALKKDLSNSNNS